MARTLNQARKVARPYTIVPDEYLSDCWNHVKTTDREKVPGDIVEAGSGKGGCCAMMAMAHAKATRRIHLFDSYQGCPPTEPRDGALAATCVGTCLATEEEAREVMAKSKYPKELTVYHTGMFSETLPNADIDVIALLRLDVDWYRATLDCLEAFYPLISPGGIIEIDDYYVWPGCYEAVHEYFNRIGWPEKVEANVYTLRKPF